MRRSRRRMLRAYWRDTTLLSREFRTALSVFLVAILGSTTLYFSIAQQVGGTTAKFYRSYLYRSVSYIFSTPVEFPESPFLEAFFFIYPALINS